MGLTAPAHSNPAYAHWLAELKTKVHNARLKAAVAVNRELLLFYWDLGGEIVRKQAQSNWGDGFLNQLSKDLMAEFPNMKGFSLRNLKYIKQWHLFYAGTDTATHIAKPSVSQVSDSNNIGIGQQLAGQIGQQAVAQLQQPDEIVTRIPWGHNIAIIAKCENREEALYYAHATLTHSWSRAVLVHQMESGLYHREGKAITNFSDALPKPQSDLAQQTLKDPYVFDFLAINTEYNERELENKLVEHITHFLLELGAGFAYIGRQIPVQVGEREFFIDLLFYHVRLHCYVVVELKTVDFEPEHAGKLNFYIKAVDEQMRQQGDEPTIGILLCKGRDRLVAEYALSDIHKPIGVSEYQLTQSLPENLKSSLPSIEAIEAELAGTRDE